MENLSESYKVHILMRLQQVVSSCEMRSKIVQSKLVLVSNYNFKLACY